ncbi:hypothetical protein [uncultured Tateyamaria sp.]|uniref:hypothetical protein n=1 Tax=Tateyamaria sp. 1078 TaxID=3417464 RepID=UPI00262E9B6A|nr:hypothetical protein [uncultured Tateyamaria sp.]
MVATTDAMFSDTYPHGSVFAPVRTVDGRRWLARGAQRFSGIVMVMAVVGLWLQPGGAFEQDVMLFKLALSAFMGMAGVALIQGARRKRSLEVEIDLERDVLRLVRPAASMFSSPVVVRRCAFSNLGTVDVVSHMVRMWDKRGELLAEVPLADPETRYALLCALSAHGKI